MGNNLSMLKFFEVELFQGCWYTYPIIKSKLDLRKLIVINCKYNRVEQRMIFYKYDQEYINTLKFKYTRKIALFMDENNKELLIYWTDYMNHAIVKYEREYKIFSRERDISDIDFWQLYSKILAIN